jgi:voltage-gated potassium channel
MHSLSKYLFEHLHFGIEDKKFTTLEKIIFIFIVVNCIFVIIESEKQIYLNFQLLFDFTRIFFGVVFTVEYIARLIAVGQLDQFSGFKGRIRYLFSIWAIIDLLAILPLFLVGMNEGFLMRLLRALRLFSLVRFGRFSVAIHNVTSAIYERRSELVFSLFISISLLFISSTILYIVEGGTQPEAFGSILRSVWWAAAALTTVGYGDIYPITPIGKFFAILSAFFSIGIVALPAGILAGAFTEKFSKK